MYIDKTILAQFVQESSSIAEVLRKSSLASSSKGYTTIRRHILNNNLDTSHFKPYKNNGKKSKQAKKPIQNYLKINTECDTKYIKKRLIAEALLKNICNECLLAPSWNNKQLTLQLDHINGIHNDNRIENLRLLCPNCHSQTDTWGRKNKKIINHCIDCNKEITRFSNKCRLCNCKSFIQPTKIKWPNINTLIELVKNSNYLQVSKELGVSDTSIRKHLQKHYHNYGKHIDLKTLVITNLSSTSS